MWPLWLAGLSSARTELICAAYWSKLASDPQTNKKPWQNSKQTVPHIHKHQQNTQLIIFQNRASLQIPVEDWPLLSLNTFCYKLHIMRGCQAKESHYCIQDKKSLHTKKSFFPCKYKSFLPCKYKIRITLCTRKEELPPLDIQKRHSSLWTYKRGEFPLLYIQRRNFLFCTHGQIHTMQWYHYMKSSSS